MKPGINSSQSTRREPLGHPNGGTAIGVHISQGCIRLSISRHQIIQKYSTVMLPPNMELFSRDFEKILKESMEVFCKGHSHAKVWTTVPSNEVSIRHLKIPKVPPAQLLQAIRWALQMEKTKSIKNIFIDYVLEGEVVVNGVKKIAVTTCAVPKDRIDSMCALFARIGFPLSGLTDSHFILSNVVTKCGVFDKKQTSIVLNIGMESSHILLFDNENEVLSRDFMLGVNAFIDASMGEVATETNSANFIAHLADTSDAAQALGDHPRASVIDAFKPVLERLMRKLNLTLESNTEKTSRLEPECIYISGPLCVCQEVRDFISAYMNLPVEPLNPLTEPCLSLNSAEPATLITASWFMPSIGLALANNPHTLNLLRPVQSTLDQAQHKNLNQIFLSIFIIVALAMGATWWWLGVCVTELKQDLITIEQNKTDDDNTLDASSLKPLIEAYVADNYNRSEIIRDRLVLAMIKELASWIDDDFQLTELKFKMDSVNSKATGISGKKGSLILLKGMVCGKQSEQAAKLAAFQIKLDESPLFSEVAIKESAASIHLNNAVIEFCFTLVPSLANIAKGGSQ